MITYTEGPCGSTKEEQIIHDDSLGAALAAAGANISQPEPIVAAEKAVSPEGESKKAAAVPTAARKATSLEAPIINNIIALIDKSVKQGNLSAIREYLHSSVSVVSGTAESPQTETVETDALLNRLENEWQGETQRLNLRISLSTDGKSAISECEIRTSGDTRASGGIAQTQTFREKITFELIDGTTRITKIERLLKKASTTTAQN